MIKPYKGKISSEMILAPYIPIYFTPTCSKIVGVKKADIYYSIIYETPGPLDGFLYHKKDGKWLKIFVLGLSDISGNGVSDLEETDEKILEALNNFERKEKLSKLLGKNYED